MRYISFLPHLSCNHSVLCNCRTDEASLTASFKRSLLGGAGRESSSASGKTVPDVKGALGIHTRCLLLLLTRIPMQVHISLMLRIVEHKHSIFRSKVLATNKLLTWGERISEADRQNSTFFLVCLNTFFWVFFIELFIFDFNRVRLAGSVFRLFEVYAASN